MPRNVMAIRDLGGLMKVKGRQGRQKRAVAAMVVVVMVAMVVVIVVIMAAVAVAVSTGSPHCHQRGCHDEHSEEKPRGCLLVVRVDAPGCWKQFLEAYVRHDAAGHSEQSAIHLILNIATLQNAVRNEPAEHLGQTNSYRKDERDQFAAGPLQSRRRHHETEGRLVDHDANGGCNCGCGKKQKKELEKKKK